MSAALTRRQILHGAALSAVGVLLTACSGQATQPTALPEPTVTTSLPSAAPRPPATLAATVGTSPAQPTVAASAAANTTPAAATSAAGTTAPTSLPTPAATVPPPAAAQPTLAATMGSATARWLDTLSTAARDEATYPFDDAERVRWHWTTPSNFPRHGLALKAMSEPQRTQVLALLRLSVSAAGYQKALDIRALQRELGNDPLLYYVTVFGTPGATAPWGWRFEGHHLSRHFTISGDRVAMTPLFHGSWPTITDAKLRALPREEDAARELVRALAGTARDRAIFRKDTLTEHVTGNAPTVAPLDPVGIPCGDLPAEGQGLVLEIIQTYLGALHPSIGDPLLARLRAAGLDQVRFGWAGPIEARRPQYYRLQGPTFLLEFDNSRNGGTHVHSVWRDFSGDFGRDLS